MAHFASGELKDNCLVPKWMLSTRRCTEKSAQLQVLRAGMLEHSSGIWQGPVPTQGSGGLTAGQSSL